MRLWHVSMLPVLPRLQILGQHREVAALRGNGFGKRHNVVNYVFKHSPIYLYAYHLRVMEEMQRRGYKPAEQWFNPCYRGKNCKPHTNIPEIDIGLIYPEHNTDYLRECLNNLKQKIDSAPEGKYSKAEREKFYNYYNEVFK